MPIQTHGCIEIMPDRFCRTTALTFLALTGFAGWPTAPIEAQSAVEIQAPAAFIALEKAWLDDRGLQDRKWSRSLYVSPDPFSGYASWMLPGIRYEIETDDPGDVPEWEGRYLAAIQRLTGGMRDVTALIRESRP